MSFAVVLEGLTLVTYITVLIGGRKTRETGWKLLTTLLFITGAVQCAAMAIVAYQFTHDEKFFAGWKLDLSWFLCIISWSVLVLSAVGVGLSAYILPPEGGYELIPNS
ncbi:MAG: hypothetical protein M1825_002418 [Sarcosagium campestre]|nr:MAG: hypothetical protein M1825_002418 [Sarcosagium campestre]